MNDSVFYEVIASPIGELLLTSNDRALTGLYMEANRGKRPAATAAKRGNAVLRAAREQLLAYFAGERLDFELPLETSGTEFQQRVWKALRSIPYGRTISYAELARRVGNPSASRAVGAANGRNPIGIIIPCHRVIGADGSLTGYGGGMERKRWLLAHEAARCGTPATADLFARA